MRMGVNTGPMVVGNMGSETRINYTIMGEAVNLAARLEGTGKVYGVSTLISHHTYERVQGVIAARLLDTIRPGQGEPVKVYEILGRKGQVASDRAEAAGLFARGYEMYTQRQLGRGHYLFRGGAQGLSRRRSVGDVHQTLSDLQTISSRPTGRQSIPWGRSGEECGPGAGRDRYDAYQCGSGAGHAIDLAGVDRARRTICALWSVRRQ